MMQAGRKRCGKGKGWGSMENSSPSSALGVSRPRRAYCQLLHLG